MIMCCKQYIICSVCGNIAIPTLVSTCACRNSLISFVNGESNASSCSLLCSLKRDAFSSKIFCAKFSKFCLRLASARLPPARPASSHPRALVFCKQDRCLFQNLIENLSPVTLQGGRPASYTRKGVKAGPYKVDGRALVSRRRLPRRSRSASSWQCVAKDHRPGRWAKPG